MAENAALSALRKRLDYIGIDKVETERDIRQMEQRLESANFKMEQLTREQEEIRAGIRELGSFVMDVPPELNRQ